MMKGGGDVLEPGDVSLHVLDGPVSTAPTPEGNSAASAAPGRTVTDEEKNED